MNTRPGRRLRRLDWPLVLISFSVLLACLFYTCAHVFWAPEPGITINSGWIVTSIDPCSAYPGWCEANQGGLQALQVGDQLIAIGHLTYEDYWDDRRRVLFDGYGPGEAVPMTLSQDGQRQTIHWQMPIITGANRARRLSGLLPYLPFWLGGTVVLLVLQPRDRRWRLLVSFNYLTAIWLAVGIVSGWGVAASSLVLHAVTWLMAPIYLHLHLIVPTSLLRGRSRYFLPLLYAIAAILAILELFQLLPASAYALGLLLAIPGSLGLLLFRLFDRSSPSARLAARLMLAGIGLAFGPGIVLWLFPKLLNAPAPGELAINFALLAFPALPLFYTYAIYKRHLGTLEFRANRLLSLYSFILLYATAFVLVFSIGSQWLSSPDSSAVFSLAVSTVFVMAAPPLRSRFQRLVGRLAYGTEHNPDEILRVFANRIPAALDREALVPLLADQVAPSLLIRQSALVLLANGDTSVVYARGVSLSQTPETPRQVQPLLAEAGRYRPPLAETAEARNESPDRHGFDWVRLAVPLEIRKRTIGVWLFGRRDPDDYYPQHDIALLAALASPVAVAVENARLYQEVQQELAERKQAEETLKEYSERLEEMVEERTDELRDAHARLIQSEKLAATGRLAVSVAHEINNPLQGISNYLSLISQQVDKDHPLHEKLEMVKLGFGRITEIVRRLRAFHRPIGEGIEPTDINGVVERALALVGHQLSLGNVEVKTELAEQELLLLGSAGQLEQVLVNLALNAQEAMPQGGELMVRTALSDNVVQVQVSDTGRGIGEEEMSKLFKPFYGGRGGGGLGLGLWISHNIIEGHGGRIEVESQVGEGTTFTISLPAYQGER